MTILVLMCVLMNVGTAALAETPSPPSKVVITSPRPGAEVGGVVSILGTVQMEGLQHYVVAFGPGHEPVQWIEVPPRRYKGVVDGRLAFWDTTAVPDGIYTLRVRAIHADGLYKYVDYLVQDLMVSNLPRTPTPRPTLEPTSTPTNTPNPTMTPTLEPTLDLDDGASPYIYISMIDQYEPLCKGWKQRYSIWLSNVGLVTVTNVVLSDTLPLGSEPLLRDSTQGATYDGDRTVVWEIGSMAPGEVVKHELQLNVATWLEAGKWLTNKVAVSSDQVPFVAKTEQSLFSDCVWQIQTEAARPLKLPTTLPTPTTSPTGVVTLSGKPTLLPTATVITIVVPDESVEASLDALTIAVTVGLVILLVVTIALVYRSLARKRR